MLGGTSQFLFVRGIFLTLCLLDAGRRLCRRRRIGVLVLGELHLFLEIADCCRALSSRPVLRQGFDSGNPHRLLFLVARGGLLNGAVDDSVLVDAAAALLLPLSLVLEMLGLFLGFCLLSRLLALHFTFAVLAVDPRCLGSGGRLLRRSLIALGGGDYGDRGGWGFGGRALVFFFDYLFLPIFFVEA